MGIRIDRGILIGIGLLALTILINSLVSFRNTRQLDEDARWVAHTQDVLMRTNLVLRTLVDAETGHRGFALTGDPDYLRPYDTAVVALPQHLAALKNLTSDNPEQQERLGQLEVHAAARMANLKEGIELRRTQGPEAVQTLLKTGAGGRAMEAVRRLVDDMAAAEEQLLDTRELQTKRAYQLAITAVIVAAVVGLLIVAAFAWLVNKTLSERQRAAALLHEQRELFRTTLGSIGDAVIATDTAGRVTFLNPVAQALTGWAMGEAAGARLEEVFHIVNESTRKTVENPALRALDSGLIMGLANHTVLIARDGTERPIDDSAAPIRQEDGSIAGAVLVFRDITERKREEAVRAEQMRLTALHADVSTALASFQSTAATLQECCAALVRHLDLALVCVWTLDQARNELELKACAGLQTPLPTRIPVGQFSIGRIASTRQPQFSNAVQDEPAGRDRDPALPEGIVAFAGYPLIVDDRSIGVLALYARHALSESILAESGPMAKGIAQYLDRRAAEERLRRSEARFQRIADAMPQIVWVTRPDGYHEYYNRRWYEYIGCTPEQCIGHGWNAPLHPDDRQRAIDRWTHSLQTGEDYEVEYRFRSHTGEYRWFLGRALPVRDAEGCIIKWYGTCTDIDDFKRIEAERQKFVTLTENSTDFIGMCDLDGTPFYINHAGLEMVGLDSMEQARRTSVGEFFFPEDREQILNEFFPAVLRDGNGEVEVRFRHFKSGNAIWMLYKVFAMTDARGQRVGLATVSRDISHRRQLEDDLRQLAADLSEANRHKDEFLATLAHELRNPLAPIRNGLQILKLAGHNGKAIEQARAMMERQLSQMVRLVDDLLDVSRITRNKLELRKERVELGAVVTNAVETSRPLIEAHRHELTVAVPAAPIYVDADVTRLAQVFANLLNNAAKYTENGGHIWLTVRQEGDQAVIAVKDTGVGIPPGMLPKVFDMFTQVDRTLERAQGGLGIGLTLVRRLVEMHDGQVEARSPGYGLGSEFLVRLPIVASAQATAAPEDSDARRAAQPRRRILVVDDNEDAAHSLSVLLGMMGNDVRVVHDGQAAVTAAREFRPDVILLDIGLPRLNGYEACRSIRQQQGSARPVIVACTGWGQEEDRRRSEDAGFDFHLVKPVDPAALEKLLVGLQSDLA